MSSIVSDDPILPITVNRTGVPVFWSKTLWMMFLQGTGFCTLRADRAFANSPNRRTWWQELDTPPKHLDAIVEMLAVAKVSPGYERAYEQKGRRIGSHKID
jgi:hypothetical protein